jgi:hydrogenase expression/formation protein HypC
MKVVESDGNMGVGEAYGVRRKIDLSFVTPIELGTYVMVHSGFALETIDEVEALETQKLLEELADASEELNSGS